LATLNLGILAHVDAGKTTLTERLLYAAGVIDEIGRVDHGTTQTDSLALERQRGITIKSAVVSFVVDGVTVNLIDTPGHPDFIAEVERVLGVLDGAVLVISAVEGVQAQTLVLHRVLRRLRVPTLLFVNKIDRVGADAGRVLAAIRQRLTPAVAVMGSPHDVGTRTAGVAPDGWREPATVDGIVEALAAADDDLLRDWVDGIRPPERHVRTALARQTAALQLHPVYFGSAITGAGVDALMRGIVEQLPAGDGDADAPAAGTVFKIERSATSEKLALVRMFSGTLRTRDRVRLRPEPDGPEDTVTGIEVFAAGATTARNQTVAGEIARVRGLASARIGDRFGDPIRTLIGDGSGDGFGVGTGDRMQARADDRTGDRFGNGFDNRVEAQVGDRLGAGIDDRFGVGFENRIGDGSDTGSGARAAPRAFSPPTLETAIVPRDPRDKPALFKALDELAEQDPLINLRQDDSRQELFLSLYGEVQREVVAQTLAADYGVEIEYRPVTPLCVERPVGTGTAIETIPRRRSPSHPFLATVGLRVEPGAPDSGVRFELAVPVTSIPMHVFGTVDAFRDAMDRAVRDTLGQGLCGWAVTDCTVTMTDSDYQAPPRKWPGTTLSDYRLLTPLVLMQALRRAGTAVCEPTLDVHLELPADVLGPVLSALAELGAKPGTPAVDGSTCTLTAELRSARLHDLQSRFPDLTRGEGVVESSFAGYRPVRTTPPPARPRTDRNPLDRDDYLRRLSGLTLE
jgi:ribosomal protection tetracycline resistance protein